MKRGTKPKVNGVCVCDGKERDCFHLQPGALNKEIDNLRNQGGPTKDLMVRPIPPKQKRRKK